MADDPRWNDDRNSQVNEPSATDPLRLGNSFADPNALDDARMGKSFIETNSSKKKKKVERVRKQENRKPLYWFLAAFFVMVVIVVLAGWLPRHYRDEDLARRASHERNDQPVVEVAQVKHASTDAGLAVPGTTIALTEAYVYARANGYLTRRLVDIGDHVRKGQLLAVIDAPDLDAQVAQAQQQLLQAQQQLENQQSQLALQKVTNDRYKVLVAKGVFSRQQGDQQDTNFQTQVANVSAAERNVEAFRANVDRMKSLRGYEEVRAPFSGVVTQRNVDVGALISAAGATSGGAGPAPQGQSSTAGGSSQAGLSNSGGTSGSASTAATSAQSPGQGGPLFAVADVTRLRILVSVPESYVAAVHVGGQAELAVAEIPGVTMTGDVTRTSNAIDPNTRTLLTEVQVDNRAGKLIPGMYTMVNFPARDGAEAPLTVSGDTIAIRHDKPMVAKVVDGKIHFVSVQLGRDFGNAVEVLTGLNAGDVVVTDVTDDVVEGRAVQTHFSTKTAPAQGPPPGPQHDASTTEQKPSENKR
ncbi:MAG: efflux RND transporter periplasmic adaptor subunit [Acidobacteriota bacterium]